VSETGLVVGLGNPILSDDAIGLHITQKLEELYNDRGPAVPEWRFVTFDGNPLDLVSYLEGVEKLLVIDSQYPHDGGPVSVQKLDRTTAGKASRAAFFTNSHGVNVIDMLDLAYRLDIATIDSAWLLLIPVDDPYVLSEQLTKKASATAEAVAEYAWHRWFGEARLQEQTGGETYA